MMTESELDGGGVLNVEGAAFTAGIKQSIRPPPPHALLSRFQPSSGCFPLRLFGVYGFSLFTARW